MEDSAYRSPERIRGSMSGFKHSSLRNQSSNNHQALSPERSSPLRRNLASDFDSKNKSSMLQDHLSPIKSSPLRSPSRERDTGRIYNLKPVSLTSVFAQNTRDHTLLKS